MAATEYMNLCADGVRPAVNRDSVTLAKRRVVSLVVNPAGALPGEQSVTYPAGSTAARAFGVTQAAIAVGTVGDVVVEGTVPCESDGSATIAAGDLLTFDNATGRVKTAAPAAAANAHIIGQAETAAAATAGAVVMVRIARSVLQG
jgi:hypothetical protein